jgi:hypothetical protein
MSFRVYENSLLRAIKLTVITTIAFLRIADNCFVCFFIHSDNVGSATVHTNSASIAFLCIDFLYSHGLPPIYTPLFQECLERAHHRLSISSGAAATTRSEWVASRFSSGRFPVFLLSSIASWHRLVSGSPLGNVPLSFRSGKG